MTQLLKVVGMDPSLRNWGLAIATFDMVTHKLVVGDVSVINPIVTQTKQVRQNSQDIETSEQLYAGAAAAVREAVAVFVEVPVGSQSARAMASYGVCVGVLGSLRAMKIPLYEVTPTEVKLAGFGKKDATKKQMIQWAMEKHPEAPWPMYVRNGVQEVSEAKAEHMSDAVAAIYAGINGKSFQQVLAFLSAKP